MLIDFMKSCTPILKDEKDDYTQILYDIEHNTDAFVGFMPAIVEDLWPIFIMEDTNARQYNRHSGESVYIIPYGSHDFWGVQGLDYIIHEWYDNDEISIGENWGFEIEETILLKSDILQKEQVVNVNGNIANAVYLRLFSVHDRVVHIIMLIDTPHVVWTYVVEKYDISTEILIDSAKGMGYWLDNIPFSSIMRNTSKPDLLPKYYFKGKYISHNAPEGFSKLYIIPEAKGKNWCECGIYKTDWT